MQQYTKRFVLIINVISTVDKHKVREQNIERKTQKERK